MKDLNDEEFKKEVEEYSGVVVADFYTSYCGPCRTFAPAFQRSADKHTDVRHVKVNVEDAADAFARYGVTHVPILVLFKGGKEIGRKGFINEKELEEWLTQNKK